MTKKFKHYKELFYLSLPILLSSLATTFINIASVPILGNYSVNAMAASAVAATIIMIFTNIFLASYAGFRILGSKAYGAKDEKGINKCIGSSLILGMSTALIIMALIYILGESIINLISQDRAIQELSNQILKINALSFPIHALTTLMFINFGLQKKTKISFFVTLIANAIGIIISIALVYGYKNIPSYGAIGAAWAGFIESILALFICTTIFVRVTQITKFNFSFDVKYIKQLFKLSYPMMVSMFFDYIGNFLMFAMISYYLGKESMAAGRLSFSLLLLSFSIIASLSSGFMILGGRSLGESNIPKFKRYYICNRNLLIALACLLSLFILAIPSNILGLLTTFEAVRDTAYTPIIIVAIICPFIAISYSNASCLRLTEKVNIDMYCNMSALWLVQLPLAFYLGIYHHFGLDGFFVAFLAYELVYCLTTYYYLLKFNKNWQEVNN